MYMCVCTGKIPSQKATKATNKLIFIKLLDYMQKSHVRSNILSQDDPKFSLVLPEKFHTNQYKISLISETKIFCVILIEINFVSKHARHFQSSKEAIKLKDIRKEGDTIFMIQRHLLIRLKLNRLTFSGGDILLYRYFLILQQLYDLFDDFSRNNYSCIKGNYWCSCYFRKNNQKCHSSHR